MDVASQLILARFIRFVAGCVTRMFDGGASQEWLVADTLRTLPEEARDASFHDFWGRFFRVTLENQDVETTFREHNGMHDSPVMRQAADAVFETARGTSYASLWEGRDVSGLDVTEADWQGLYRDAYVTTVLRCLVKKREKKEQEEKAEQESLRKTVEEQQRVAREAMVAQRRAMEEAMIEQQRLRQNAADSLRKVADARLAISTRLAEKTKAAAAAEEALAAAAKEAAAAAKEAAAAAEVAATMCEDGNSYEWLFLRPSSRKHWRRMPEEGFSRGQERRKVAKPNVHHTPSPSPASSQELETGTKRGDDLKI